VLVGDEVVASRKGGFLAALFGGGWPDDDQVVRAVTRRIDRRNDA
jgi:hypothetical protein